LTPLRDIEVIGDVILARLPFGSAIARGALFGVGAHGAGTARAHQIGETEGAGGRSQPCPRLYTLAKE
jgi:putative effector of murein hydrolase